MVVKEKAVRTIRLFAATIVPFGGEARYFVPKRGRAGTCSEQDWPVLSRSDGFMTQAIERVIRSECMPVERIEQPTTPHPPLERHVTLGMGLRRVGRKSGFRRTLGKPDKPREQRRGLGLMPRDKFRRVGSLRGAEHIASEEVEGAPGRTEREGRGTVTEFVLAAEILARGHGVVVKNLGLGAKVDRQAEFSREAKSQFIIITPVGALDGSKPPHRPHGVGGNGEIQEPGVPIPPITPRIIRGPHEMMKKDHRSLTQELGEEGIG